MEWFSIHNVKWEELKKQPPKSVFNKILFNGGVAGGGYQRKMAHNQCWAVFCVSLHHEATDKEKKKERDRKQNVPITNYRWKREDQVSAAVDGVKKNLLTMYRAHRWSWQMIPLETWGKSKAWKL